MHILNHVCIGIWNKTLRYFSYVLGILKGQSANQNCMQYQNRIHPNVLIFKRYMYKILVKDKSFHARIAFQSILKVALALKGNSSWPFFSIAAQLLEYRKLFFFFFLCLAKDCEDLRIGERKLLSQSPRGGGLECSWFQS